MRFFRFFFIRIERSVLTGPRRFANPVDEMGINKVGVIFSMYLVACYSRHVTIVKTN